MSLLLLVHSEPVDAPQPIRPAYTFFSCDADGHLLATSGGLPGMVGVAPEFQVLRLRHGPLDQTWKQHCQRISTESAKLAPFRTDDVADTVLRVLQRNFDENVCRGVYVPVSEPGLDRPSEVRS